ncbi:MAG: hypothetical protein J7K54_04425 [Candidatus Aenigmarchaeota archaeon]|nr:hypothetical protein [Candidatus Aenigmarchaeota archaeon]
MALTDYYNDFLAISDICESAGLGSDDTMIFNYIHRRAAESGMGADYFRNSPRDDQAEDLWHLGKNIGLGDENDFHLKVGYVNSGMGKTREERFADVMVELYGTANASGAVKPELLLRQAMLYMDSEYREKMLSAYENDILPALERIIRAPDEISRPLSH